MQKLLLLACICLSFLSTISTHSVFASDNGSTTNMNSSNFMVDLYQMDPLKGSHAAGATQGGKASFFAIIGSITDIILIIIPILAVISMLIAGYFYIFSAGDSEKAGRAKTIIKWNIVALFISLLSYGIVKIIASLFS